MLVNLINITYCAVKILPYQEERFYKYQQESVQEFRFALSGEIRQQVFYAIFVKNMETSIKSNAISSRDTIYKSCKVMLYNKLGEKILLSDWLKTIGTKAEEITIYIVKIPSLRINLCLR